MVIVGTIAYDDIETPSEKANGILGGSVSHSGLAASFHLRPPPGHPPRIGVVSVVGQDFSTYHQMVLEDAGLNLAGVALNEGETPRRYRKYDETMGRIGLPRIESNVLEGFTPVLPKAWTSPEVLLCANSNPKMQLDILNQSSGSRINALDTSENWIKEEFENLSQAMRLSDVVILDENEAKLLSGEKVLTHSISSITSGEALHGGIAAGKGPRSVIVKRGSKHRREKWN